MDFVQSNTSPTERQQQHSESNLYLSERLVGQDERLDYLVNLFEQLQLATVDTCDPALDLLTFAQTAYYFAVIMKKKRTPKPVEKNEPSVSEKRQGNKRKISSTLSDRQAGFEEIWPNKQVFELPPKQKRNRFEVQAMSMTNEEIIGTSSHVQYPFLQGYSLIRQQTSQNLRSNFNTTRSTLEIDLRNSRLYGPSLGSPEFGVEEFDTGINSPLSEDDIIISEDSEAIGLVYLVDRDTLTRNPLHAHELNIGIILEPFHRGKGYAHQVIEMVLKVAFETAQCHRVQAILPDHVAKDHAICLFTQMRFDHEGTRRRAFFSPMENVYKDVTYMGMLDTDWMLRQTDRKRTQGIGCPAPKSVWDELLARHQREREELLNWEAGIRYSGTLRPRAQTPTQSCFRPMKVDEDGDGMGDESSLEAGCSLFKMEPKEEVIELKIVPRGNESDPFVTSSDSDSTSERSASPGGYSSTASSPGSAWEVVESSDSALDSASSSNFDSGDEEAMFEFVRVTSQST